MNNTRNISKVLHSNTKQIFRYEKIMKNQKKTNPLNFLFFWVLSNSIQTKNINFFDVSNSSSSTTFVQYTWQAIFQKHTRANAADASARKSCSERVGREMEKYDYWFGGKPRKLRASYDDEHSTERKNRKDQENIAISEPKYSIYPNEGQNWHVWKACFDWKRWLWFNLFGDW